MSYITYKSKFFNATNYDGNLGNYRVKSQSGSVTFRYTFQIPHDFRSLISAKLLGNVSAGAAQASRDIDIFVSAHQEGETDNQKTASDTTSTYDLSTFANKTYGLNATTLLPDPAAGDIIGLEINQNSLGGPVSYFGVEFNYC